MKQYIDLTIVFGARNPDGSYGLSVRSPYGDANGVMVPPTTDPEYRALAERLVAFQTDEAGLNRLGQLLFAALFHDPQVRTIYDRTRGAVESEENLRARIRLELPSEASQSVEIGNLPWEFLYDPDSGAALSLLDFSVVRYPIVQAVKTSLKAELPLKVLLTSAVTPPPTEIQKELDMVAKGLESLGDQVRIVKEPHLTPQILQRRMREGFHVWHFVGHGGVLPDGQGVLVLEDPSSAPDDLADPLVFKASQLQVLLNRSGVRLVVLDACETSTLTIDPFRSIAPPLIRAQVPAVIAMQLPVPELTTIAFATEFYSMLAQGEPIDACVNEGRKAVMIAASLDRPDWGIATVYARIADGRLFEFAGNASTGTTGGAAPVVGQTSPLTGNTTVDLGSGNSINGNIEIGTIIKGVQMVRFGGMDVLQIADKDGRMVQGSSTGATSEAVYQEELRRLEQLLDSDQRRLAQLKLRQSRYGTSTPPEVETEIEDLGQQIYNQLKARVELRLGRLEALQREAAPGDQEGARRIAELAATYLDDANALKRMELPWREKELRIASNAIDRTKAQQQLDQLNHQLDTLNTQSKNATKQL